MKLAIRQHSHASLNRQRRKSLRIHSTADCGLDGVANTSLERGLHRALAPEVFHPDRLQHGNISRGGDFSEALAAKLLELLAQFAHDSRSGQCSAPLVRTNIAIIKRQRARP